MSCSISVVVPARNAASTLGTQLGALLGQATDVEFEVIVVDNASTDDTATIASAFPQVRVVEASTLGVNAARNAGAAAATGSVVLIADADDIVQPGWMAAMYEASLQADCFGGALDHVPLNEAVTRQRWNVPETVSVHRGPGVVPSPIGANCGFRRAVWVQLGGFDERVYGGGDEYEFFWRAQAQGFSYAEAPDAVISYRLRASWRSILRREYGAGRAMVRMFDVTGANGSPVEGPLAVLRVYGWIVKEAVLGAGDRRRRWSAARTAARRVGRLVESARRRRWFL